MEPRCRAVGAVQVQRLLGEEACGTGFGVGGGVPLGRRGGPPRPSWIRAQCWGAVTRVLGPGPGGRLDSLAGGLSWEHSESARIDQLQDVFIQTRQRPPILPSIAPSPGPLSPCSWFYIQAPPSHGAVDACVLTDGPPSPQALLAVAQTMGFGGAHRRVPRSHLPSQGRGRGSGAPGRAVVPALQAGPHFLPPFLIPRAPSILSKESALSPETTTPRLQYSPART